MYEQRFVFQPEGTALRIVDWVTKRAIVQPEQLIVAVNGHVVDVLHKRDGYIVGNFRAEDEIELRHPLYKREVVQFSALQRPFSYTVALLSTIKHPEQTTYTSFRTTKQMTLMLERQWIERQRIELDGMTKVYTLQANHFTSGERWRIESAEYRIVDVNVNERSFTVTPSLPMTTSADVIFTEVDGHYLLPRHYTTSYIVRGIYEEQQQLKEVKAGQSEIVTFQWQDRN